MEATATLPIQGTLMPLITTAPDRVEPPARSAGTTLERRGDGRMWLRHQGTETPVSVTPCFPWTQPRRFLSLRNADDEEILFVQEPNDLDAGSRAVLEEALADAGFVFDLAAIEEIREEVEIRHWRVRTRQGDRSFQTRLDEWPRELPGGGLVIRDVAGDLYRLSDPGALDSRSRGLLWAFLD